MWLKHSSNTVMWPCCDATFKGHRNGMDWGGCPENVLEHEANLVTSGKLYDGGAVGHVWSLTPQFAKYGEWGEFSISFGHTKTGRFLASGGFVPALVICVRPTFSTWRRPWPHFRAIIVDVGAERLGRLLGDGCRYSGTPVVRWWRWTSRRPTWRCSSTRAKASTMETAGQLGYLV